MRLRAVSTPVGELHGRDCVHLNSITFPERLGVLLLRGELNGDLCERRNPGAFLPFEIRFSGVLALRIIELDSWDWSCVSCFDEVLDSPWIVELGGKVTGAHRHFVLQTYDDVFDVVCDNAEVLVERQLGAEPATLRFAAAANVLVPAILLLERKGWTIEHLASCEVPTWIARRDSTELVGDDPLQLLALASISDAQGASWSASASEIGETLRRFGLGNA